MAGGNGFRADLNQLCYPCGIAVADDNTLYVADNGNNRVVAWHSGAVTGVVVADGLTLPTGVTVDGDSLIICDTGRVTRWPRQRGQQKVTLIENVSCYSVAIDDERNLYVTDYSKHEIKRYSPGAKTGTLVAGGNREGDDLKQLNGPRYVCVDKNDAVYASEYFNHRVTKWSRGATKGVVVAGGRGYGSSSQHLTAPTGVVVDSSGTVYVAERGNNRVTRWVNGTGTVIVNGLSEPTGLCFDRQGNLYIADCDNHRVLRFAIA